MRVGVIGPVGPDLFAENIADCLPDVGVEAVRLGAHRFTMSGRKGNALTKLASATPKLDVRLQQSVANRALEAECDVVISVAGALLPETVKRLGANGAKVALWFPDHVANLGRQQMFDAEYDRMYFTDPEFAGRMDDLLEASVAYLPEACNPRIHRPIGQAGSKGGVVVAGNYYPSRIALLDRMEADKLPLRLYGSEFVGWIPKRPIMELHTHEYLLGEGKSQVFREATVVLNNLHPVENGVNCRLFEATAAGAAVICENRPAVHDLFDVGTEVLTYENYGQLVELIGQVTATPGLTETIGNAASARAHSEHTYQHRLRQILADVV